MCVCFPLLASLLLAPSFAWTAHRSAWIAHRPHAWSGGAVRATAVAVAALEPKQLTMELVRSNRTVQLMRLWEEHGDDFNAMHISAFWNRLGKLVRSSRAEQSWLRARGAALSPVRERTLAMLPDLEARSLVNTAHGLASARLLASSPAWLQLWGSLDGAARAQCDRRQLTPQNLANLAWSFATARHGVAPLFEIIAAQSRPQIADFSPQGREVAEMQPRCRQAQPR